eukprot:5990335-Prymnesium_polylepis.1
MYSLKRSSSFSSFRRPSMPSWRHTARRSSHSPASPGAKPVTGEGAGLMRSMSHDEILELLRMQDSSFPPPPLLEPLDSFPEFSLEPGQRLQSPKAVP